MALVTIIGMNDARRRQQACTVFRRKWDTIERADAMQRRAVAEACGCDRGTHLPLWWRRPSWSKQRWRAICVRSGVRAWLRARLAAEVQAEPQWSTPSLRSEARRMPRDGRDLRRHVR